MIRRFWQLVITAKTFVLLAAAVVLVALLATRAPAPEAVKAFAALSKSSTMSNFEAGEHHRMPADMTGFHAHYCHAPMKAFSVIATLTPDLRQADSFEPVRPVDYRSLFASLPSRDPPVPRTAI